MYDSRNLPDHPDITWAMRTGYPSWNQPIEDTCEICGEELSSDDTYEDHDHDKICKNCLLYLHKKDWW